MNRTFALAMSLSTSLALSLPAMAQDTTTPAPAPAEGAAAPADGAAAPAAETPAPAEAPAPQGNATAETPADSGLTMGANDTGDGQPQPGQPYTKDEFGDWQLQYVRAEEGEDPCQLYQLLKDEDGNAVAEFSLFRLPDGGKASAGATVVVPLETSLNEDLRLGVDGSQGKRYRFSFCSTVGCFARIGLTPDDIAAMKRGSVASLTIVPWAAPDVQVKLDMSLIGFTAGYDQVTVAAAQ